MPRSIKLLMYFVVGVVAAALMLVGYQELYGALLQAELAQTNPSFVRAADALDPSDPLYRALYGRHGFYGQTNDSRHISGLLGQYITPQDVIARSEPKVERNASSWSLLGGRIPAFWKESTQWCVRIKYRDGDPSDFADALFNIHGLKNAPALTLPARQLPQPPQEVQDIIAKYADGIVLAVEFERSGESKRKIDNRTWRLIPAAVICPKSTEQPGLSRQTLGYAFR